MSLPVCKKNEIWKDLFAAPLFIAEPIHICEARGAFAAVKHRSRDVSNHCHRMLFLGDNFVLTLALSKGRCASIPLLRLLRRVSAEVLAASIYPVFRWIPSELNRVDHISRLWEGARLRRLRDQHGSGGTQAEAWCIATPERSPSRSTSPAGGEGLGIPAEVYSDAEEEWFRGVAGRDVAAEAIEARCPREWTPDEDCRSKRGSDLPLEATGSAGGSRRSALLPPGDHPIAGVGADCRTTSTRGDEQQIAAERFGQGRCLGEEASGSQGEEGTRQAPPTASHLVAARHEGPDYRSGGAGDAPRRFQGITKSA